MKRVVIILSFILSLFWGGQTEAAAPLREAAGSGSCVSQDIRSRDICLTSAQGYSFSGDSSTNYVSVRTSQTGRRTPPQTKSTFRILKGGKVVNNNHLHPFLSGSFLPLSGTHISQRYLFTLCRLRL